MTEFSPFLTDVSRQTLGPGVLSMADFAPDQLGTIALPFALPDMPNHAVLTRRAEFVAGRLLCAMVLDDMGLSGTVPRGADRAPVWPVGVTGSISHTLNQAQGHVGVWLTRAEKTTLGLDIEPIATEAALDAILTGVLVQSERVLLVEDARDATACFCAKEALFKALYPKVKQIFGFDAARIVGVTPGLVTLETTRALCPLVPRGATFDVQIAGCDAGVRAALAVNWPLQRA